MPTSKSPASATSATASRPSSQKGAPQPSDGARSAKSNVVGLGPVSPPPSEARCPLYGAFFGLREPPFDLTPNPRFLFLAPRHREALSNLRYGLSTAKGFTFLLGEAGTGKSTLLRAALAEMGQTPGRCAFVSNPALTRAEFYEVLAREFALSDEAGRSKARFLSELQQSVEARAAGGGLTSLIIDEAQSLPDELLEEVRLLGNLETATTKLLSIVLSGQPELAERLNEPSLRQLKQRVALRCELHPLSLEETAAYISGRLRIAGGSPGDVFTRETVMAIHAASHGIPRTINVLCDNALLGGFAAQVKPVSVDVVAEVCRDFDLGALESQAQGQPPHQPAAVPTPGAAAIARPQARRFSFFS
ncbi:MAG: ExeA family protein [Vicinamibacterales bacterium]